MTKSLALAILVAAGLSTSAIAADSPCKGLEQAVCTSNMLCAWNPARVKGEKSAKTGKEYKTSAKAHCRKKPLAKAAQN